LATLREALGKMYALPRPGKVRDLLTTAVRLNVSGLLQAGRCCSQAMMRSRAWFSDEWFVQEHGVLHRAYDAPINCFVITSARLPRSGDGRIPTFVDRTGPGDDVRR
jgi:hypothetical protein